jgi:hypothetical protein
MKLTSWSFQSFAIALGVVQGETAVFRRGIAL